ncbi:MAG: hypothetical protein ACOCW2_02545 [Chitinivibrionales bacterium]
MRLSFVCTTITLSAFTAFAQTADNATPWYVLEPVEARLFTWILLMIVAVVIAWYRIKHIK